MRIRSSFPVLLLLVVILTTLVYLFSIYEVNYSGNSKKPLNIVTEPYFKPVIEPTLNTITDPTLKPVSHYLKSQTDSLSPLPDLKPTSSVTSQPHSKSLPYSINDDSSNPIFDHVFLLNRARRMDRLEIVLPMLNHVGINPNVFTAVDKNSYEVKDWEKPAERACFESHRSMLRQIIINKYNWTLILEDDINFNTTFKTNLIEYRNLVIKSHPTAQMIYFGSFLDSYSWDGVINPTVFRSSNTYGTFAYAVSLSGAKRFHEILETYDGPVDCFDKSLIEAYVVHPHICTGIIALKSDLRDRDEADSQQLDGQPKFKQPVYELLFGKDSRARNDSGDKKNQKDVQEEKKVAKDQVAEKKSTHSPNEAEKSKDEKKVATNAVNSKEEMKRIDSKQDLERSI